MARDDEENLDGVPVWLGSRSPKTDVVPFWIPMMILVNPHPNWKRDQASRTMCADPESSPLGMLDSHLHNGYASQIHPDPLSISHLPLSISKVRTLIYRAHTLPISRSSSSISLFRLLFLTHEWVSLPYIFASPFKS